MERQASSICQTSMKNLEIKLFNQAFEVFKEFGPNRLIPRDQRLKEKFPDLSDDEISDLIQSFTEIEGYAFDLGFKVNLKELSYEDGKHQLAEKYPALDEERVSGTFYQAMYFSCK